MEQNTGVGLYGGWGKTFTTRTSTSSIKSLRISDVAVAAWNLVIQ